MWRHSWLLLLVGPVVGAAPRGRSRVGLHQRSLGSPRLSPPTKVATTTTKSHAVLQSLRGGGASWDNVQPVATGIGQAAATWAVTAGPFLALWTWELRRNAKVKFAPKKQKQQLQGMQDALQKHRSIKAMVAKGAVGWSGWTMIAVTLLYASIQKVTVWQGFPTPLYLIGFHALFFVLEGTLDSCLDEAAPLQPRITQAVAFVAQMVVITKLITRADILGGPGHAYFLAEALNLTLVNVLARGAIDHAYWLSLAVYTFGLVGVGQWQGWLVGLPDGMTKVAFGSYCAAFVGSYFVGLGLVALTGLDIRQALQVTRILVTILLLWVAQVPPSWLLYGVLTLVAFFHTKVLVDSVALAAVEQSLQEL